MVNIPVPIYLTGDHVLGTKENPVFAIIKHVDITAAADLGFESDVDKTQITLELNKEIFIWTANDTSLRNFVNAWGRESDNWLNKNVALWTSTTNVFGKEKKVIYGAPVKSDKK